MKRMRRAKGFASLPLGLAAKVQVLFLGLVGVQNESLVHLAVPLDLDRLHKA